MVLLDVTPACEHLRMQPACKVLRGHIDAVTVSTGLRRLGRAPQRGMCGRTDRRSESLMGESAWGGVYLVRTVGGPLAQLAASIKDDLGEIAVRVRSGFGGG